MNKWDNTVLQRAFKLNCAPAVPETLNLEGYMLKVNHQGGIK
jgi:hypothetical protein